jgi:hypothetical protein
LLTTKGTFVPSVTLHKVKKRRERRRVSERAYLLHG